MVFGGCIRWNLPEVDRFAPVHPIPFTKTISDVVDVLRNGSW